MVEDMPPGKPTGARRHAAVEMPIAARPRSGRPSIGPVRSVRSGAGLGAGLAGGEPVAPFRCRRALHSDRVERMMVWGSERVEVDDVRASD
jgi:hypothetical protein